MATKITPYGKRGGVERDDCIYYTRAAKTNYVIIAKFATSGGNARLDFLDLKRTTKAMRPMSLGFQGLPRGRARNACELRKRKYQ